MKTAVVIAAAAIALASASAGCSTLQTREVLRSPATTTAEADRPGRALASGPALLHLTTAGEGTVALYYADDAGVAGAGCPRASAEHAAPFLVLPKGSHVSDVAVPGGKRVCAAFLDASAIRIDWLAEEFPKPVRKVEAVVVAHN